MPPLKSKLGFSLIEIMIVVAIIGILVVIALSMIGNRRNAADDARVKSELSRLKIAFEDYYNDHNCYPPSTWFDDASDCNSSSLAPYLSTISCDRKTGLPYKLQTDATGCTWFALYARLQMTSDPKYHEFFSGSDLLGTYAVTSDNINVYPDSTPAPSSSTNQYYCQGIDNCSLIPGGRTCTPSYADANCGGTPTNKCTSISTCN